MSTTIRLSEEFHEKISEMAESSDKSMQEVMDSLVQEALESDDTSVKEVMTSLLDDSDAESVPSDAVGRCPYTGEIYTEQDVNEYGLISSNRCVKPDVPSRIPVEELEPVDG